MAKTNFATRNVQKLMFIRKYGNACAESVWTRENIIKSPLKEIQLPLLTVSDYIWQNLDKWADKPAMVKQYPINQHYI